MNLRELRKKSNLTQDQLAKNCHVPQSVISSLESGKRNNPLLDTAIKLADALGCTLDELVGRTPQARTAYKNNRTVASPLEILNGGYMGNK